MYDTLNNFDGYCSLCNFVLTEIREIRRERLVAVYAALLVLSNKKLY